MSGTAHHLPAGYVQKYCHAVRLTKPSSLQPGRGALVESDHLHCSSRHVTEEGETLLKRFINDDSCTRIFFLGGAKEMTCSEAFPQAGKKKVVFCQKTKECKLDEKSMDNVFDQCVVGDINAPLLQAMQGMLGSVYLPILSNAENTKGWPEVAMKAPTMLAASPTSSPRPPWDDSSWACPP